MNFKVKGWKKFQHFKDRTPPWIKLYRDLLDDPDWYELPGNIAKYLVMLWLMASEDPERDGNLPSLRKIAFRLRITEKQTITLIKRLSHWILIENDINSISTRYQSDAPETETETETETEKKYPDWLDLNLWKEFKKYRTAIKSPLTPHAEKLCLADLKTQMDENYKQADIINQTIMSGKWKSFYPVKNKKIEQTYPKGSFGDNLFLKQAFNLLGTGYTKEDFNNHCIAFNRKPEDVLTEIGNITGKFPK